MTDTVFCCNILSMLEQWRQQWEPVPLLYPIDILHILFYPSSISFISYFKANGRPRIEPSVLTRNECQLALQSCWQS